MVFSCPLSVARNTRTVFYIVFVSKLLFLKKMCELFSKSCFLAVFIFLIVLFETSFFLKIDPRPKEGVGVGHNT